jgi:Xaa-Pro aminopeptidase
MIHQKRRQELLSKLSGNAVVIISSNSEQKRNSDVNYPFRPDSSFWYLTGFTEPDAIAVFSKKNYSIFLRPKDKTKEIWNGKRLGVKSAPKVLLADNAYSIDDFLKTIHKFFDKNNIVYFDDFSTNKLNENITSILANVTKSLKPVISEMRLIKDSTEIQNMQTSANLAAKAHMTAMTKASPGLYEYHIAAEIDAEFRSGNSDHAYPPIVASGKHSCVLHYTENNKILNDGDLLLIDAGCESLGYASDITRTFPINGSFSKAQKQIYQIVLSAQKSAIASIKPGEKVNTPHEIACDIISRELIKLGIMKELNNLSEFYMHKTGHWLGLDVHDVGEYEIDNDFRDFEEGMVTTVEPGIYIRKNDKIDSKYWNIGIRIEDDVLVTKDGNHVLSKSAVKEVKDIEYLMSQNIT